MLDLPYSALMRDESAFVEFSLDLSEPVEIGDFVSAFSGLGGQFERFLKAENPDLTDEVKIYVREVRKGSIIAELIPVAYHTVVSTMDQAIIVKQFTGFVRDRILAYTTPGSKLEKTSKSELTEVMRTVVAVANDPMGTGTLSTVRFKDGKREIDVALKFQTPEARTAVQQIEAHAEEIQNLTSAQYENKLMVFFQSNRKDTEKTGEKAVIEDITDKPLAVLYASDLARERTKSEMLSGDRNVYKLGFFVDVDVSHRNGKPVAYRVMSVRDVIELPDDD